MVLPHVNKFRSVYTKPAFSKHVSRCLK